MFQLQPTSKEEGDAATRESATFLPPLDCCYFPDAMQPRNGRPNCQKWRRIGILPGYSDKCQAANFFTPGLDSSYRRFAGSHLSLFPYSIKELALASIKHLRVRVLNQRATLLS